MESAFPSCCCISIALLGSLREASSIRANSSRLHKALISLNGRAGTTLKASSLVTFTIKSTDVGWSSLKPSLR